jgi:hypothetical protein
MRLTEFQLSTIKSAFKTHFSHGDTLWLFGSRTDDLKRGGDIDLYIETTEADGDIVYKMERKFWVELQNRLGEQKIDIVVKQLSANKTKPIYEEARKTGILLMKKKMTFEGYIHVVDIHASRLQMAFEDAKNLLPITRETFVNLSKKEIYIFELLNSRFSKMQDDIGSKIFSVILKIAAKESVAFIDNLNALEALNIIPSSEWWQDLRKLRNEIAHDYEDEYDELTKHTNELMGRVQQLLEYWQSLKPILEELKSKLPRE